MSKTKLDFKNINHQIVISALAGLIDDGYTAREVLELMEDCKNQLFFALREMEIENKKKRGEINGS